MRKIALFSLAALHLACSGDDDPKGGGEGVGSGGKAGGAGTGSLVAGGRSGGAGSGGASGQSGAAGIGGAGGSIDLQPSSSVCGNGELEPGERCDGTKGTTTDISCADLLGDPQATGTPSCDRCFPSYLGCVSCLDGRKNGLETDIDCGGSCAACGLGRACKVDTDCAAPLGCYGGVCNGVQVTSFDEGVGEVPQGAGRAFVLQVRSTLPLASTTTAALDGGAGVTLESTSPVDVRRLVARVAPEADVKGTLTIDGHPFALTWTRPTGSTPSSLSVTGVSGKVGPCSGNGAPLASETTSTGPTAGLELPAEGIVCLRIDLSGEAAQPWTASLGGTEIAGPVGPAQSSLDLEFPITGSPARLDTGNTTVDLAIRFGLSATTSLLVPKRFVHSPKTYRQGATGLGTTSSPAGVVLTTASLGGPYANRTVIQLSGPHAIGPAGLVVPDNVVLVGLDADASLVGAPGGSGAIVTLGNNSELRGLTIVGAASDPLAGDCVSVTGKGAVLRDVKVRGCKTGVRLKKDASATMIGKSVDDIRQVTEAIVGETGASWTGVDLGLVGDGTASALGAVSGFEAGAFSLIRPRISGFARGLSVGKGAIADAFDPTMDVTLGPVEVGENATLTLSGGNLGVSGPSASGMFTRVGATLEARGILLTGAKKGGVTAAAGTVHLVASVLRECGDPGTSAAAVMDGGTLRANGLRIEKPGQLGIFALKGAKELSLTGTVVEGTITRSIWVFGGKATLRTVQLLDPGEAGLAFGDPAEPIDARDVDIVRHLPAALPAHLVFVDRPTTPSNDQLSFRNLVAGAGEVVSSVPGSPVCRRELFDPQGGWYLRTNGADQTACF